MDSNWLVGAPMSACPLLSPADLAEPQPVPFPLSAERLPAVPTDLAASLPLLFGESTIISDCGLDARARRLLRRLEDRGLAVLMRHEDIDSEGRTHVTFSYHLRPAHCEAPPVVRQAINEFTALYDRLPPAAWKHAAA